MSPPQKESRRKKAFMADEKKRAFFCQVKIPV
ncbi:Hypothetical protein Minf_0591 [Methylacidiphilum infernorum V4]|uniref:Uncharacterized protein n=1 Tax=Methylacidiphilum infernorum (isolate V4) TaxID=481448 RepID=B3DZY8_METI4|nr:Hypothetical protein Minf_0591 [Methylacidiphilum infernorum V4]